MNLNLDYIYDYVLNLVLSKNLKEAENFLENIYFKKIRNIDFLNILGIIKYMYCDFKGAKYYFKESVTMEINNKAISFLDYMESEEFKLLEIKFKEGVNLIRDKEYNKSIKLLEEVYKLKGDLIEVRILLALLYGKMGEIDKASKFIEEAFFMDNSNFKIKEIYESLKEEEKEKEFELSFSENILNLILILNYRINSFYEEELRNRSDTIELLCEKLKSFEK